MLDFTNAAGDIRRLNNESLMSMLLGAETAEALSGKNLVTLFGLEAATDSRLCESEAGYLAFPVLIAAKELLCRAIKEQMRSGVSMSAPSQVWDYLKLTLNGLAYEVFTVLFLDSQNRLIQADEMFRGTLTSTSVYPREVVKMALQYNSAAVIFAHNHPSGVAEPSRADELITKTLKQALALVDVKVLDHFIVADNEILSFAERGLL
jgi:DNA repair protein RadC